MVKITLHRLTKEYVQYKFFPEGRGEEYGIVQLNLAPRKRVLVKDIENVWDEYKGHAWHRMEDMAREGNFLQEAWAIWY